MADNPFEVVPAPSYATGYAAPLLDFSLLSGQNRTQPQPDQQQSTQSLGQALAALAQPKSSSQSQTNSGGDYARAISSIESGGNYQEKGPVTSSGDRAYGKYQIMGENIPGWTAETFGRPMALSDFLNNPKAQDAVFKHKFGQYVQKYGAGGAARAWFAGEGGMNNPQARDMLGTSVADYQRRFLKNLNQ